MAPKTITIAAIQMDATPATLTERLARAGRLAEQATQAGAELVVLPELFNCGYTYSNENYDRAEPPNGVTDTWMKETAARLNIHLAGSIMLLDQDEIYNALLLYAPDGRCWRYDKNYPWAWERAYFRDSQRITVAQTDLGNIGMMICWDSAHTELWRRYAGRIDLMMVCSSPPDVSDPVYHMPDGKRVTFDDMGSISAALKGSATLVFSQMLNQQAAWLGVPLVNTVACGHIRTKIPSSHASLISFLPSAPWLVRYLRHADKIEMSCDFVAGCKIVDSQGQDLALLSQEQGESFIIAPVTLSGERRFPQETQPGTPINWLNYVISDEILAMMSIPVYRQGSRKTWGNQMAPIQANTRRWLGYTGALVLAAYLAGRFSVRKDGKRGK